jgi:hypothetical protein
MIQAHFNNNNNNLNNIIFSYIIIFFDLVPAEEQPLPFKLTPTSGWILQPHPHASGRFSYPASHSSYPLACDLFF